jgi:iron-sulfur cluster assembly protein
MISITERAIAKVKEFSESEGLGYFIVRTKCIGEGCSSMSYDLSFDENIEEIDEVLEIDGIKVIIDPFSLMYMDGVEIDFVEDTMGAAFRFLNNLAAKTSCGCGSSFGI